MKINELAKRYKITVQGMGKFVRKNLDKINADGIHAKNTETGWQFDSEAVRIIDELRNINKIAILEEIETEKIKELKKELDNMNKLLLLTQSKLVDTQEKLLESEKKILAETVSSARLQAKLELLENNEKALKDELSRIKNRGFWDRVFNNLA